MTPPDQRLTARPQPMQESGSLLSLATRPVDQTVARTPYAPQRESDLFAYLNQLIRHKILILAIALIGTTLTALYTLSKPPLYQVTATLRLKPKEYTFLQDSRGEFFHGYDDSEYTNTQLRLLTSPQLIRSAIVRLNLQADPTFLTSHAETDLRTSLRRILYRANQTPPVLVQPQPAGAGSEDSESIAPASAILLEPYVQTVLAHLVIEQQANTSLIDVHFTSTRPDLAYKVPEELVRLFIERNDKYEDHDSSSALDAIARQVAEAQTALQRGERERLEYLRSHNLPLAEGQGRNLTADRLATLSAQVLAAEAEHKTLATQLDQARQTSDVTTLAKLTEGTDMQTLQTSLHQLEQRRADLLSIYTDKWPEVKRIDGQLEVVRGRINSMASGAVELLKLRLAAAAKRELEVREAYEREKAEANRQTRDQIELASLNQQIETNKQIFNTLFQREKEMEINANNKTTRVSLAVPATMPIEPIPTRRLSVILLSFLASLALACGIVFLLFQLDSRLKSVEDVAQYVQLPTLACIPAFRPLTNGDHALAFNLRSDASEAYRQLRTSLLFNADSPPRSILVTSGRPLEGKTTTAISLALTYAEAGSSVLLIDCDLRRPQVHAHLRIPNARGFTELVEGEAALEDVSRPYLPQPKLSVITSGHTSAHPADLLNAAATQRLFHSLASKFDYVIVDCPPASSFADATILASAVDGVLLVAHGKRNSRFVLRHVIARLSAAGATVCGVVLNHVDLQRDSYYARYYSYNDTAA